MANAFGYLAENSGNPFAVIFIQYNRITDNETEQATGKNACCKCCPTDMSYLVFQNKQWDQQNDKRDETTNDARIEQPCLESHAVCAIERQERECLDGVEYGACTGDNHQVHRLALRNVQTYDHDHEGEGE